MRDNKTMTLDKTHPIRVLHIASGDLWAGAEVQLFTLAKALKNNTNTIVDIVLFNHGTLEQKLLSCDINVIVLDESKLNSLAILRRGSPSGCACLRRISG